MPTQQRVQANEERRPARPAQQPASRGQEHPIRLLQPRPCDLPAQNGQLVPSTTISSSLNSRERSRSAATASARRNSRYTSETNTRRPPPRSRTRSATYGPSLRAAGPDASHDGFTYPTPATAVHLWRKVPRGSLGRAHVPSSRVVAEAAASRVEAPPWAPSQARTGLLTRLTDACAAAFASTVHAGPAGRGRAETRSMPAAETAERAVVAAAHSERPAAASGAQMVLSLWRHNGRRCETDTA
jgi:hypothetical protein